MAFKDNIGVTEELKVQMVECAAQQPTIEAFQDEIVRIRWKDKDGAFTRETTHFYRDFKIVDNQ
jgi:hypothetical protein